MNSSDRLHYNVIRSGGTGYYTEARGLIAVRGGEAVQFLDGLITNDMKTLVDGGRMLAAFPDAKGRLIAVVRIVRLSERFLIETEEATHQKVHDNLMRFTMAGDFFVEDLSEEYQYIKVWDRSFIPITPPFIEFDRRGGTDYFVHSEDAPDFVGELKYRDSIDVSGELFETLRIESGLPRFGVDMDETTIVPELGLDDMISYTKGCYIGQEIIARIHFRGHVAKRLTGIVAEADTNLATNTELLTEDGKNAGRVSSVSISPKLQRPIGLAYVRYDYLSEGTKLRAGDTAVEVSKLPFV
ncbi:MAG TPA: glycine cleavage T C-terminal barrel domain-containing protein [Pyrinomonadaceae bacterium]|nr:glycine cleavage T C-terminal barrel domain-containing protein [Pyrinomonadaceae bacterium]